MIWNLGGTLNREGNHRPTTQAWQVEIQRHQAWVLFRKEPDSSHEHYIRHGFAVHVYQDGIITGHDTEWY
jgi:hypothetical protein